MPQKAPPLTFTTLYESPLVRVQDYICRSERGGPGDEEVYTANTIVLMRHGVFCKHFGPRSVTADVNQAIFFSKGSTVRVSHPADCGDRGTVFTLAPRVLRDIIRELDPTVDDRPDRPFPFVTGPCDAGAFWRHRELVQRLAGQDVQPLEHLWADVTALQLTADILEAAFRQAGITRPRRAATDQEHADRAEAAKRYLATSMGDRVTLDDVAKAVHTSPFHFTRIFQERVGVPVHRYLTRLRLRAALERLAEGEDDLSGLALDLGFSSHSHFADSFRKEFGRTPSEVRRSASRRALRETSQDLEAPAPPGPKDPGRRLLALEEGASRMAMIEAGKKAPAFTLPSSEGGEVSLKDFKGKTVVLYFYPKDDTPGCTREACDFRDSQAPIKKAGAVVFGVSGDSLESHGRFKTKYKLNFPLLSDVGNEVATKFGAYGEKTLYGRKFMGVIRSTFIIDGDGVVSKVFPKVKVDGHAEKVLEALKTLVK